MPTTTSRPESEAKRTPRKQPETLRLRAVSPAFTVNDVQASIRWYRDVLGFTLREEWKHEGQLMAATLRAGDVDLMLSQDDFAKGRDRKKGIGVRLHCQTVQDVDDIATEIKARGGTLDQEPTTHPWGIRDFAIIDPDGFRISVGNWEV